MDYQNPYKPKKNTNDAVYSANSQTGAETVSKPSVAGSPAVSGYGEYLANLQKQQAASNPAVTTGQSAAYPATNSPATAAVQAKKASYMPAKDNSATQNFLATAAQAAAHPIDYSKQPASMAPSGYGEYLAGPANQPSAPVRTTAAQGTPARYSGYGEYLAAQAGQGTTPAANPVKYSSYGAYLAGEEQPAAGQPVAPVKYSGYGEYLAGEGQPAAISAPTQGTDSTASEPQTVSPVKSASSSSGYGAFLEQMAKNHEVENTPESALGYTDWQQKYGSDYVEQYNERVKQGYGEYLEGLATHGQNAERMAQSGLTGSGYGEYLAGVAYQQKQQNLQDAQKEAAAAQKQSFASYADYLDSISAENKAKQAAHDSMMAGVYQDALTAVQQGTSLDAYLAGYGDTLTDEERAEITDKYLKAAMSNTRASITAATGIADYGQIVSQLKAACGYYNDDIPEDIKKEFNDILAAGQERNYKFLLEFANDTTSGAPRMAAWTAEMGINVSNPHDGEVVGNEVVETMYTRGLITDDQRKGYWFTITANHIDNYFDKDSPGNTVGKIRELAKLSDAGKITPDQYKELLGMLGERIRSEYGDVEVRRVTFWTDSGITVEYKQGKNKNEAIEIYPDRMDKTVRSDDQNYGSVASSFVKGKGSFVGKDNEECEFGTINGHVAIKVTVDGVSTYYYNEKDNNHGYANTKHNLDFILVMCT